MLSDIIVSTVPVPSLAVRSWRLLGFEREIKEKLSDAKIEQEMKRFESIRDSREFTKGLLPALSLQFLGKSQ